MSLFSAEPTLLTTISASHLCWLRFFPVVERVNESTKPLPPVPSLRRNKGSEFSCMMKEAKMLGMALGIPSLDGCSMDCHKDWVEVRITAIFNLASVAHKVFDELLVNDGGNK
ncbi:flap endonuclease GEN-like 2 [Carex littledalei]|uniref:Flap endonuclease GEN-like 2 n=1 Tax=Carex littledalei TaxID=544730 RepID=A0A833QMQ5_9POAL|nr:flap endonuclease GEN-like 2 [Carex littledalei]